MNNSRKKAPVASQRKYVVLNAKTAKDIVTDYLSTVKIMNKDIKFGLPEINDRYHTWKVPVQLNLCDVGDIIIDAYTAQVKPDLSSSPQVMQERITKARLNVIQKKGSRKRNEFLVSKLQNMVIKGRCESVLRTLPEQSIDMIFTSPPYYNARKQYSEYETYQDYLSQMRQVIRECKRVLVDGKFFIMNSSHVLVPRASRNESSSRIAVPFDLHQIFIEEGFEFVDDIIWQKPEGAGWASGRGRRFSADRNPMQYKAVPVTEYVMVYRKKPCILIDHFIRNNPDQSIIKESKIGDDYEKTNVWYICPAHDKRHPAIFPLELAEKVIKYYSFKKDVILDPFGGIGTTAKAAAKLNRRFCTIELSDSYVKYALNDLRNLSNDLLNPFSFEYIDLSSQPKIAPIKSLEILIKKLMEEGFSKDELYDILEKSAKKKN